MAASTSVGPGRVFISYRRDDSAFPAGWLYDRLCAHLGSAQVFKDVDSIDPGDDFFRVIEDAVGSCQVLLALIGDRWLDITDETGNRRLDDPDDFVRLEIEAALRRDVRVIPILVGRAPMPKSEQLPDTLRGLVRRNAIELSPNRFEPDLARLVRAIDKTLAVIGERRTDAPALVDQTSRWPGPAAADGPEAPPSGRGNLLADPQWADALSAFFAERWVEAVQRFEALQALYPGEVRIETRLEEARRRRNISDWSAKAEAAATEGDWDTAVSALENLTAADPGYPDAGARLEQARIAQRRRALVDEMTALHQAGRWDAVVAAAQQLARLDPDNPDPGGIVSDAKAKIRDADLAERYVQALNHLDQEDWQQAAELFTAIEQEQPGFRDATALLKTAQQNLASAAKAETTERTTTPPAEPPPVQGSKKGTGESSHPGEKHAVPEDVKRRLPARAPETEVPAGHLDSPKSGSPSGTEDRGPASVPSTDGTPTVEGVPLFQRLSRRTKIMVGVGAIVVVVVVIVAVIVVNVFGVSRSSRESRLFAKLPIHYDRSDCASNPGGGSELAELNCTDRTTTPPVDAFYALYQSHSDLVSEFKSFVDQRTSSTWDDRLEPCPGRAQSPTSWEHEGSGGSVACLSNSQYVGVVWTLDASLVMGWTFGADNVRWWQSHFG
jgi:tetratricopeptide (TPR) repeat protein